MFQNWIKFFHLKCAGSALKCTETQLRGGGGGYFERYGKIKARQSKNLHLKNATQRAATSEVQDLVTKVQTKLSGI